MSEKGYDWVTWSFLECHCLLSMLEAHAGSRRKRGPLGLSAFPLSLTHNRITLYTFVSPKLPCTVGPLQFYAYGASQMQADGAKEGWTYILCIVLLGHMFHCPIRLKLQKEKKFRDKMIKNFMMMTAEHESQHRPF